MLFPFLIIQQCLFSQTLLQKLLRHGVGAAGDGLEHAAAAYYHVQALDIELLCLQKVSDDFLAEILLVYDIGELTDLLRGMPQRLLEQQCLVLEHADFRGGRTGIYDQTFYGHLIFLLISAPYLPRPAPRHGRRISGRESNASVNPSGRRAEQMLF